MEKVTFEHPISGETRVVDAVTEQMIPLMVKGFRQVPGASVTQEPVQPPAAVPIAKKTEVTEDGR